MSLAVALDAEGDAAGSAVEQQVGVGDDVLVASAGLHAHQVVGDAAHAVLRLPLLRLGREDRVAGCALPDPPLVVGVEAHQRRHLLTALRVADGVPGLLARRQGRQRLDLGEVGQRRERVHAPRRQSQPGRPALDGDLGMLRERLGQRGVVGQVTEPQCVAMGDPRAEAQGHCLRLEPVVDQQQALAHALQVHRRAGHPRHAILVPTARHHGLEDGAALERPAAHQRVGEEDRAIGLELVLAGDGGERPEVLPRGAVGLELPSEEARHPLVQALGDQPAGGERPRPHGLVAADLARAVAHVAQLGDRDGPPEPAAAQPCVAHRGAADGGAAVDAVVVGVAEVVVVGQHVHLPRVPAQGAGQRREGGVAARRGLGAEDPHAVPQPEPPQVLPQGVVVAPEGRWVEGAGRVVGLREARLVPQRDLLDAGVLADDLEVVDAGGEALGELGGVVGRVVEGVVVGVGRRGVGLGRGVDALSEPLAAPCRAIAAAPVGPQDVDATLLAEVEHAVVVAHGGGAEGEALPVHVGRVVVVVGRLPLPEVHAVADPLGPCPGQELEEGGPRALVPGGEAAVAELEVPSDPVVEAPDADPLDVDGHGVVGFAPLAGQQALVAGVGLGEAVEDGLDVVIGGLRQDEVAPAEGVGRRVEGGCPGQALLRAVGIEVADVDGKAHDVAGLRLNAERLPGEGGLDDVALGRDVRADADEGRVGDLQQRVAVEIHPRLRARAGGTDDELEVPGVVAALAVVVHVERDLDAIPLIELCQGRCRDDRVIEHLDRDIEIRRVPQRREPEARVLVRLCLAERRARAIDLDEPLGLPAARVAVDLHPASLRLRADHMIGAVCIARRRNRQPHRHQLPARDAHAAPCDARPAPRTRVYRPHTRRSTSRHADGVG